MAGARPNAVMASLHSDSRTLNRFRSMHAWQAFRLAKRYTPTPTYYSYLGVAI